MCWLVREFGIVTSSVFLPHEVSDFTSPLRRIGAVIRGEDSHFFLARLVVRSPSLSRGGVVNVKTLIVMSCDTSEGRRRGQVGRQAGTQIGTRPGRNCSLIFDSRSIKDR